MHTVLMLSVVLLTVAFTPDAYSINTKCCTVDSSICTSEYCIVYVHSNVQKQISECCNVHSCVIISVLQSCTGKCCTDHRTCPTTSMTRWCASPCSCSTDTTLPTGLSSLVLCRHRYTNQPSNKPANQPVS